MRYLRFGILGPDLRSLTYVPAAGAKVELTLTPDGAFLLVTEGQAAPAGELLTRYSDGEVRRGDVGLGGPGTLVPRK